MVDYKNRTELSDNGQKRNKANSKAKSMSLQRNIILQKSIAKNNAVLTSMCAQPGISSFLFAKERAISLRTGGYGFFSTRLVPVWGKLSTASPN